ncbi:MAG TPA: hypothetical protein P5550_05830 [Bacteroidales bacterium]|nr:hypothetical protein [Bacteroidales bacterium]
MRRPRVAALRYSIIPAFLILLQPLTLHAQCCAGGAGSPIAGGTSQGVLQQGQIELNTNFQYIRSDRFYTGSRRADRKYFDRFRSAYQYFRLAYGLSERFTMSVETGNYFVKEEIGLNGDPARTYSSKGIGDLVLFPRYTVMNRVTPSHTTELTLGLGIKFPLGSYNDSTGAVEPFSGQTYYVTNPQAVQLSSGAQDAILYAFLYRGYPSQGFRVFLSGLYVRKSWNPLGERMGDFASLGLFAGKTFRYRYGLTLQLRAEWMDRMDINSDILMYSYPNYDPEATGYRKVFLSPQLSYTYGNLTGYALVDLPLYQYVRETQVGTQWQASAGLSYKLKVRER